MSLSQRDNKEDDDGAGQNFAGKVGGAFPLKLLTYYTHRHHEFRSKRGNNKTLFQLTYVRSSELLAFFFSPLQVINSNVHPITRNSVLFLLFLTKLFSILIFLFFRNWRIRVLDDVKLRFLAAIKLIFVVEFHNSYKIRVLVVSYNCSYVFLCRIASIFGCNWAKFL